MVSLFAWTEEKGDEKKRKEVEGLPAFSVGKIDRIRMWKVGERVRAVQPMGDLGSLYPFIAGIGISITMQT
ncbi:putative ketol-acid reductoisomerase (NADP(+)) [Helianthus annuus]|nr:putative ketol-acid reductoisomerase (NADP(+)) [Helianthus annuus]